MCFACVSVHVTDGGDYLHQGQRDLRDQTEECTSDKISGSKKAPRAEWPLRDTQKGSSLKHLLSAGE